MSKSLSDMTVSELWILFGETRSLEVRNEIVVRNMSLAHYVANRYRVRAPEHQRIEDIVSYAYEGLIDSVEKYDYTLGYHFATYAVRRISGSILDGLRKEDPLPRSARKRVKDYEIVAAHIFEWSGKEPSQLEIAEQLHITQAELGYIQRDSHSQNSFIEADDLPVTVDTRYDDPSLHSEVLEIGAHLAAKIAKLSEDERNFILSHYGAGLTLADLSGILEVTESRLVQMRKAVVEQITGS